MAPALRTPSSMAFDRPVSVLQLEYIFPACDGRGAPQSRQRASKCSQKAQVDAPWSFGFDIVIAFQRLICRLLHTPGFWTQHGVR